MLQHRLRAKAACEPCRARKRKCDGQRPCALCVRYEYDCEYKDRSRRRKRSESAISSNPNPSPGSSIAQGSSSTPRNVLDLATQINSAEIHKRNMEANAGSIFPHVLGAKAISSDGQRVFAIGWNLRSRPQKEAVHPSPCSLLTLFECRKLADVYFEKIHPVYGFIDQSEFADTVTQRWQHPDTPATDFDTIICGVAALGSLFTLNSDTEREEQLIRYAQGLLAGSRTACHASTDCVRGWLLRTLYLRSTSYPQASWMASCVAMHLIEDAGIHQESDDRSMLYLDALDGTEQEESRRRLFWLCHICNTWISQEYGRAKVALGNINSKMPTSSSGDYTTALVVLYQLSESIDPVTPQEPAVFEHCLVQLSNMDLHHDALKLSQSNLAMAFYRRLRASATSIAASTMSIIIRLGIQSLDAALRLADSYCPWWHVSNAPFQFLCILLAIDTQESLLHVPQALTTLKTVNRRFETEETHKTVETAQLLIRLSRKRKQQEAATLNELELSSDENLGRNIDQVPIVDPVGTEDVEGVSRWPVDEQLLTQMIEEFEWDSFLEWPTSF